MREVHVRIGVHRYAYHTDPGCPALNGKQETCGGRETIPEEKAKERGLKACRLCRK
ncbi:hypothetical protein V1L54_05060 [Streptomyces sp. TRM 70361]|uniref:hypothetical protein n=1 Tax=Streptomyces sp. TRM 70361 TaxID=3116553 RepID=UPI002E7C1E28|nr:hypothetical protein [Streptomyces sp. TRM 70361]MEE1938786.1 hypothetical protein [Streptomyces sp. TRM 70361]